MHEVQHKIQAAQFVTTSALALAELLKWLERAQLVHTQRAYDKNKRYAPHAPEVDACARAKCASPTSSASKTRGHRHDARLHRGFALQLAVATVYAVHATRWGM
jgi:uncharacterized protein with PIN domain